MEEGIASASSTSPSYLIVPPPALYASAHPTNLQGSIPLTLGHAAPKRLDSYGCLVGPEAALQFPSFFRFLLTLDAPLLVSNRPSQKCLSLLLPSPPLPRGLFLLETRPPLANETLQSAVVDALDVINMQLEETVKSSYDWYTKTYKIDASVRFAFSMVACATAVCTAPCNSFRTEKP